MRRLIIGTGLFLSIFLIVLNLMVVVGNHFLTNSSYHKLRTDNVIIGNSHPECAFNDAIIENFTNYSHSGEAYFYTYIKAKEILKNNTNIKNVFIEYDYEDVCTVRDSWIWEKKHMQQMYPRYAYSMGIEEYETLMGGNLTDFLLVHLFQTVVRRQEFFSLNDESKGTYWGRHLSLVAHDIDSLVPLHHLQVENQQLELSDFHLFFLKQTITLFKNNNINVYLIRSPVHSSISHRMVTGKELMVLLGSEGSNIEFLDFYNYPLFNSEFRDAGHLNAKGANEFSSFFNSLVGSGLLKQMDKESFVSVAIEERRLERFAPITGSGDVVSSRNAE